MKAKIPLLNLIVLLFVLVSPSFCLAQASVAQSLSVSPTLFEMAASPSQKWSSSVKVINNNKTPLTIYPDVVNFSAKGEQGESTFLPVLEEFKDGSTLAEWITISREGITIPPEQSYSIPITVNVPEDAAPGGHFAAILIGTRPPELEGRIQVGTSQIVTSLFFVRIAGDVVENGVVREFRVTKSFVDTPKANFEVRFENKGNVYLQPQGEIVITNMWGKERGTIPINKQTHFGNVLPNSIRKFEFSWNSEPSFADIGRYKAVLSLAYGLDARQFVDRTTYFYVIPVKAGSIVLAFMIAFVLFVRWSIKAYIRRMLTLAGVDTASYNESTKSKKSFVQDGDVRIVRSASVRAPVEKSVLDLQKRLKTSSTIAQKIKSIFSFVVSYRLFFGSFVVVCISVVAIYVFIAQATKEHRDYNVVIDTPDSEISLSSEEILYNKNNETSAAVDLELDNKMQNFDLILVNSSDKPGAAGSLKTSLEEEGYVVESLQSDFEESKKKTVIIYDAVVQDEAFALSKILNNALPSASPKLDSVDPTITVYIGNDYSFE